MLVHIYFNLLTLTLTLLKYLTTLVTVINFYWANWKCVTIPSATLVKNLWTDMPSNYILFLS